MLSLHDLARAKNILYGETNEKDSWRRVWEIRGPSALRQFWNWNFRPPAF